MTFPRVFSQHAYSTVACGKLHHLGTDQMQGWSARVGLHGIHISNEHIIGKDEEAYKRYSVPLKDVKFTDAKEIKRAGIGKGPGKVSDDFSVDGAIEVIKRHFTDIYYDRCKRNNPILLKVSLNQPHYPYLTDEDKFEYYINRVKPYLNQTLFNHPFLSRHKVTEGTDVSTRDITRTTAAYYGMIETIDQQYARVLDALKNAGENIDDWIVLYTTDHGEMLGQHSVWEKQSFFEGSVKVPLFIRYPKLIQPGTIINENVNLCDLFATLCQMCNLPIPEGLDSRSLFGLLSGNEQNWINETISQFYGNLMIKQDNLKYIYYPDMKEVLFDLETDPEENMNLINSRKYVSNLEKFRKRKKELGHDY